MINRDELYKFYIEENHTRVETAKHFKLPVSRIYKYAKRYNLLKNRHKYTDKDIENIRKLYIDKNLSILEIEKVLNIPFCTVDRILKKKGITKPKELQHEHRVNAYKKYTAEFWSARNEKSKLTLQKLYGNNVINPSQIPGMQSKTHSEEATQKAILTRRLNKSFNTSSPEKRIGRKLRKSFPDLITQYSSSKYPFCCDFYIPSQDLYIEYQGHWTHGFHPFNKSNLEDMSKLKKWKSKNSKFYNKAIEVWTIRDVKKRRVAKENNLNWIEFFSEKELYDYFKLAD